MFTALPTFALLLPLLPGGGLDAAQIPADTRWIVHLDLQAMLATELGRELSQTAQSFAGEEEGELAKLEREFGLNPLADIFAVTVHGVHGEADAVAQIRTSAKLDQVLEKVRAQMSVKSHSSYGVEYLSLSQGGGEQLFARIESLGAAERLLILSAKSENVVQAAQVRAGNAPSLQASPATAYRRGPSPGAWLFVASGAPLAELTGLASASQVADLVQRGVFQLGEVDGNFFASIEVDARSHADARRLSSILQGGTALLELAMADQDVPEGALELLSALSVEHLGEGVRVGLRLPTRELSEILKQVERMHEE